MKKGFILNLIFYFITIVSLGQNMPVVIDAASGNLGDDFDVLDENDVQFIRPGTNLINASFPDDTSKVVTYTIPFSEPGNYHFYAKIRVGSGSWDDDSFFLARDFGDASPNDGSHWHVVNGIANSGHTNSFDVVSGGGNAGAMVWKWVNISSFLNAQSPVIFSVDSIENPLSFSIGAREDNFDIAKIAFANAELEYTVSNLELIQPGSPIGGFPEEAYQKVLTYVDPVLPGAHPDKTIMRVGDDFYMTGSSFHITPYVPIYHSTDLVHWHIISRVVPPTWSGSINDSPSGGIWQGALAEFGGYFWVYYSINSQQHFSKATSMEGPWSAPTRVTGSTVTGYDNSVFVDDGIPYMLMKNGKLVNRMQQIDTITGQLTGSLMNLDWINATEKYSWAEGPVMTKRDGWYYYFIAGNVGGGQWVLRTSEISADPQFWEELGPFFMTITDPAASFRGPNHVSQPIELDDGTWWALSQSFQSLGSDNWQGKGRQGLLHQVRWDENGKPSGTAPTSKPQLKPNLPKSGIPWNLPRSDYFENPTLQLTWYFLNRPAASKYSLTEREGWLTLNPGTGNTHLLHKEGGYYFTLTTKIDFEATANGQEAGFYLTNGNESVTARVYSGYNNGKKLGFRFTDAQTSQDVSFEVDNPLGNVLWLKVERDYHNLKGYYSANGVEWTQIGNQISAINLDKDQPSYNWWVGTSNGLYASRKTAHFGKYLFRDGFSGLAAIGHNNHFGVEPKGTGQNRGMINTSSKGGWLMLGGVELGQQARVPASVEVEAASTSGGVLEIWIGDIEEEGRKIAEITISDTGGATNWKTFSAEVSDVSGQHDLYLRWKGPANAFIIKSIRFNFSEIYLSNSEEKVLHPETNEWRVYPNPFHQSFFIESGYTENIYNIYSIQGNVISSGRFAGGHPEKIESMGLSPGIYFIELISGQKREVFKLKKMSSE